MKKILTIALFFLVSCALLSAQASVEVDTSAMSYEKLRDTLSGIVSHSDSVEVAMQKQIEKNKLRTFTGYRLRIFFDNKQNARTVSEQLAVSFSETYPDIPVYRVYNNPYWRVTVGDFRSKSDALRFLNLIRESYPSVFLVKESFSTI